MTGTSRPSRGVLLMALGGPTSLEDVEPYLRDLRGGRPTPDELVEEIRERYRRIGGGSPLVEVTRAQATALGRRLEELGHPARCEAGMRHWHPNLRESVARLLDGGVTDLTGLCMTPYYSTWSVGGYLAALASALEAIDPSVQPRTVQSWHAEPSLADAFAHRVTEGLAVLAAQGVTDPLVLFTAHSLPGVHDPASEPYVLQLRATMAAIVARLPPLRTRFAYQSVGRREGPWLGPPAEEEIDRAARAGERGILLVPFGFVADNLEILYDIDIEMRAQAGSLGLAFARTRSLNDDPRLVEALARAVLDAPVAPSTPGRPA